MGITFDRFMDIAIHVGAYDVAEGWNLYQFEYYCKMFGPMTEDQAYEICDLTRNIAEDEPANANYFGD